MARTAHIADTDLLAAARAVFLEKGVAGTTAEVATRAGVSEGTLFKRFGSKTRLFEAAMTELSDTSGIVEKVAFGAAGKPADVVMYELGMVVLQRFQAIVPFVAMHMAGAMSHEHLPLFGKGTPAPMRMLEAVEALFAALVEEGTLRKVRVDVLARMLVGALWQYAFLDYMMRRFTGLEAHSVGPDDFVREQVSILLLGVAPEASRARIASGARPTSTKSKANK